ncbi:ensconsin isoform X3 [Chiloscyllium punctatum]|uniref:ensconsin isoform X3 n=1 Tax=Chiloscyllium punctatum TaxID=137246 RepID=UPI003B63F700
MSERHCETSNNYVHLSCVTCCWPLCTNLCLCYLAQRRAGPDFPLVELPAAPRWVRLLLTSGAMAEAEGVASRVDGGDGVGAAEAHVKVEDQKGQLSNHSISTTGQSVNSGTKQDFSVLRVDDKQRLAKERREVRQRQQAARDQLLLEKEEKARQHYEKQLEERKKKIEEQRLKEERRRAAVEEKRKQRLQEEKERHEAVVRRTIERSQRIKQKSNRWSWGGALQSNAAINRDDADRRSVSTMNLAKNADPVISKRLSSSSATLLNSPDRARRLQLSPWESNIVNRLLTPTHSFLARSRSTAALYGNGQDPVSASSIAPPTCKNLHNRTSDWSRFIVGIPDVSGQKKSPYHPKVDKKEKERENEREKNALVALTMNASVKKSNSPLIVKHKSPVPSTVRSSTKVSTSAVNEKPFDLPPDSVKSSLNLQLPSPGNVGPVKTSESEKNDQEKEGLQDDENADKQLPVSPPTASVKQPMSVEESATKPECKETVQVILSSTPGKTTAGTTDPAEATRLLAEKRRIAREQRDREEEEKREQEEKERQMKEEMFRRKSEEKARREEAARRLEEERKLREAQQKLEEEQQFLEEKAQKERLEIERLQKQKDDDARAREEAERLRIEREKHFQKEEQERMERKKRLEQIMQRTRKSDTSEKKDNRVSLTEQRNEVHKLASLDEASCQNPNLTEAMPKVPEEMVDQETVIKNVDNKVEFVDHSQIDKACPAAEKIIRENGVSVQNENFEDFIDLSLEIKATRVATETRSDNCQGKDDIPVNPIIAFEENGSVELLTKVESIQTHQTTEVI